MHHGVCEKDRPITIVEEYDHQVLVPILVKVSKYLKPRHEESPPPLTPNNNDSLWELHAFYT
jgi:hypothetical protein